jgi:gliding motility-associated-like protein
MRFLKHILIVLFVWFISTNEAKAQIDTTFWFAAPWVTPDHAQNFPMAFHISTFNNPTVVRLRQPASTYDTTFTVPANSLFSKHVTHILSQVESKPADDNSLTTGFEITSDFPIVAVYDFLSSGNNPETYSLKGQNGLGLEFVTPFQTSWNNKILGSDNNGDGVVTQPKQMFSIVATEPNTTIYITPRCITVGLHPANVTYSVVLPLAGSVYTCENNVQNTSVPGNSLAGSIVVSDKKIAVTVSDDSVNPSGGGGCYDMLGDQLVPTDVIGKEYIVNKGFLNAGSDESAYVTATENFTTISIEDINGITTTILNQGDTYQYSITEQLTHVIADKNVYVNHMSGYGCELGSAILPPINCAGSSSVSFPRTNSFSFLLDIVCPAGSEGDFLVNGSATIVQATDFSPVPGTGGLFVGAQISVPTSTIPSGSSNFISNSSELFSLGIINGGATGGCLYHYLSSFLRRVIVDAGPDQDLCNAETTVNLTGSVSGGTITGLWQVIDGLGTLNSPSSLTTSYTVVPADVTQGYLTFALQSVGNCEPEYDTVKVSFIPSPDVEISSITSSYCKNNISTIPLNGIKQFATASDWSVVNGGAFDNIGDLNTTYTPSPSDISIDSVVIYLESLGSIYSCPEDRDSVVIYFTEPPVVTIGADIVICDNETEIANNGSVTGPTNTGMWTTSGTGVFDASQLDLANNYLIANSDYGMGTFYLYLESTNNGNCNIVKDSIEITVLIQPIAEITTEDSLCANVNTLNLVGNITAGYSSNWVVDGSGSISTPSSLNTTYNIVPNDTIGGLMDVILEISGGICPVDNDTLTINFVAPPLVNSGIDQDYCSNEVIELNGTLNGTASSASWTSTGTGGFSPSNNLLNTFYIASSQDVANGSVELILTSSSDHGCLADDDTLVVTYKPQPNANFTFNSTCEDDQINFTDISSAPSGTVDTWQYNFGDNVTSIEQSPVHAYSGSGNFDITLIISSTNDCFDTITKSVFINPLPEPSFTSSTACLNGEVFFINNTFISSGEIAQWNWDFDNMNSSSNLQNPSNIFTNSGIITVVLEAISDSGCVASISENVTVLGGPTAEFSYSPTIAFASENIVFTDLSTDGPITNWLWDFGDFSGGISQNETNQYSEAGEYNITLTVTDENECKNSITKPIFIGNPPVLPTAFTPNSDGENDVFIIRGGPFDDVDFKIYNNWGQLVFSSNDVLKGWDGTYKGVDSPVGVYTWTYTILIGENKINKEGDVTLMR